MKKNQNQHPEQPTRIIKEEDHIRWGSTYWGVAILRAIAAKRFQANIVYQRLGVWLKSWGIND